jgi:plasmid stabilization system protein ParE
VSKARWTARAVADLLAIGDYIAAHNPSAARSWVERLRKRATDAARTPRGGRVVPELGRDDVREVFVRTYRIVYRLASDDIVVLTVFEGHRLLGEIDPDADE